MPGIIDVVGCRDITGAPAHRQPPPPQRSNALDPLSLQTANDLELYERVAALFQAPPIDDRAARHDWHRSYEPIGGL